MGELVRGSVFGRAGGGGDGGKRWACGRSAGAEELLALPLSYFDFSAGF